MRYCWLLVAWATISNALVVLYPPPNSNMPIGIPFSVTWETSISAPYRQLINIYLLSSPSPTDVVQVLQTNVNTVMNGCSVTVSQVQPNNYYLYLNDTNVDEGNKVVGPFYFTLSVTTAPAMPSASSAVSPSASSGPPKFPVWIIPIIIVLILAKIACIILCLWRVGYSLTCGGRLLRKGRIEYQYELPEDGVNPAGYYGGRTYQNHNYQMKPYQVDAYPPQANYAPPPHQPYVANYPPTSPPPQHWKSSGDYY